MHRAFLIFFKGGVGVKASKTPYRGLGGTLWVRTPGTLTLPNPIRARYPKIRVLYAYRTVFGESVHGVINMENEDGFEPTSEFTHLSLPLQGTSLRMDSNQYHQGC